jgi:hypothetical protein
MTNEQRLALLEALKFYIPVASPHKPDRHIELLEEVVQELEQETTPPPEEQDLFDDPV